MAFAPDLRTTIWGKGTKLSSQDHLPRLQHRTGPAEELLLPLSQEASISDTAPATVSCRTRFLCHNSLAKHCPPLCSATQFQIRISPKDSCLVDPESHPKSTCKKAWEMWFLASQTQHMREGLKQVLNEPLSRNHYSARKIILSTL